MPVECVTELSRVLSFEWLPQAAATEATLETQLPFLWHAAAAATAASRLRIAFIGFLQIFNGFQVDALLLSCHFIIFFCTIFSLASQKGCHSLLLSVFPHVPHVASC